MNKRKFALIASLMNDFFYDDDDDDEKEVLSLMIASKAVKQNIFKRRRVCIKNYEGVIMKYSMDDFQSHFRLQRRTIRILLEKMGNVIYQASPLGGRPSCPEKQLLLTIWLLANQEVYRSVADRFDVSISTAWEYFQRVVNTLVSFSPHYIKWPEEYAKVKKSFKKRGGMDGVIGAIDGTHIPIMCPKFMPNRYLNRKQFHSIILQAVCDSSYMFTDCFAGCPGSVHDARVFRISPLFRHIMPTINEDCHLLGDTAYPNSVNLITPYRDNGFLNDQQKKFNHLHSATRVPIEQTFGLLKGRFRSLKFMNILRTEFIPNAVIACCVLHNICMLNEDDDVEISVEISDVNTISNQDITGDPMSCNKRDMICSRMIP